jgi:hypothetical protein
MLLDRVQKAGEHRDVRLLSFSIFGCEVIDVNARDSTVAPVSRFIVERRYRRIYVRSWRRHICPW